MTQEEKQILLKDLCARLPYKVIIEGPEEPEIMTIKDLAVAFVIQEPYRPYLRPMSSMTEEERKEYNDIVKNTIDFYDCPKSEETCFFIIPIDWLNKRHFDYRGLLEKGLAIKVTEENNPYEN